MARARHILSSNGNKISGLMHRIIPASLLVALAGLGLNGRASANMDERPELDTYQAGTVPFELSQTIKDDNRRISKLEHSNRFDEARSICREDIGLIRRRLGSDHPLIISPLIRLAELARHDRDHEQAVELLRRIERMQRKLCGVDSPDVNETFVTYLEQLQKMGKFDQSDMLAKQRLRLLANSGEFGNYAKARVSYFLALSPSTNKAESIVLARQAAKNAITVRCNDREGMIRFLVSLAEYLQTVKQNDVVGLTLNRILQLRGPRVSLFDNRIRTCYQKLGVTPPF